MHYHDLSKSEHFASHDTDTGVEYSPVSEDQGYSDVAFMHNDKEINFIFRDDDSTFFVIAYTDGSSLRVRLNESFDVVLENRTILKVL